jgi:hypothetical protein
MSGTKLTYSRDVFVRMFERIANGETLKAICSEPGMPTQQTVFTRLDNDETLIELYARAREKQADVLAEEIVHIADTTLDPAKGRLQMDARKWFASKVAPKKYGDKTDITSNGNTIAVAPIAWSDE